jgi:hypothetical protein
LRLDQARSGVLEGVCETLLEGAAKEQIRLRRSLAPRPQKGTTILVPSKPWASD